AGKRRFRYPAYGKLCHRERSGKDPDTGRYGKPYRPSPGKSGASSSGRKEGYRDFPYGQKQLYYTDKKWDNPAESGAVRDICVFLPPGRGRDGAYPDRVQIPSPAALPESGGLRSYCEQ